MPYMRRHLPRVIRKTALPHVIQDAALLRVIQKTDIPHVIQQAALLHVMLKTDSPCVSHSTWCKLHFTVVLR